MILSLNFILKAFIPLNAVFGFTLIFLLQILVYHLFRINFLCFPHFLRLVVLLLFFLHRVLAI